MPLSVGVGGSWKTVTAVWVGVGGAWKRVTSLKVGVGGAWKEALATVTVSGEPVADSAVSPSGASASLVFRSDGTVDSVTNTNGTVQIDASTDWIIPNSAAPGSYEVQATLNSGSLTSGTTGSWLALTSDRTWTVSRSGVGTSSANLTIEVRLGTTVLDSGTYTIEASVA